MRVRMTLLTPIPSPVLDCFRDVPHRNARRNPGAEHWSSLYTRESFEAVCELYAEDFAAFGCALLAQPELYCISLSPSLSSLCL